MNADNPAAIQNVVLQRDDLQNGLLGTCREVSRATAVSNTFLPVKTQWPLNNYLCILNWFVSSYFSLHSNKPQSWNFHSIHRVVFLEFCFCQELSAYWLQLVQYFYNVYVITKEVNKANKLFHAIVNKGKHRFLSDIPSDT